MQISRLASFLDGPTYILLQHAFNQIRPGVKLACSAACIKLPLALLQASIWLNAVNKASIWLTAVLQTSYGSTLLHHASKLWLNAVHPQLIDVYQASVWFSAMHRRHQFMARCYASGITIWLIPMHYVSIWVDAVHP